MDVLLINSRMKFKDVMLWKKPNRRHFKSVRQSCFTSICHRIKHLIIRTANVILHAITFQIISFFCIIFQLLISQLQTYIPICNGYAMGMQWVSNAMGVFGQDSKWQQSSIFTVSMVDIFIYTRTAKLPTALHATTFWPY